MSNQDQQVQVVFSAKTPDGHEYKVFNDGTCSGFPAGTILTNFWLAILNHERGLQLKLAKEYQEYREFNQLSAAAKHQALVDWLEEQGYQTIFSMSFDPPEQLNFRSQSESISSQE